MKVYLIGIGMGSPENITIEGFNAINESQILIGAERMIEPYKDNKEVFISYKADEIKEFLKNKNVNTVSVLLSGDVGFYSGAKKLIEVLKAYDVELIAGISSVVYFCAKIKKSWQNVKLTSLHGIENNIIGYIREYQNVFSLLSNSDKQNSISEICKKLCKYSMDNVKVYIGENLSYDNEKIIIANACDLVDYKGENLSVVIFQNDEYIDNAFFSIDDDEFIRGDVPMTKSEIRQVSIGKLKLKKDSLIFDIGAGTGSVAIEIARKVIDGKVYAIEKNKKAVDLIEKNKIKFKVDNLEIIDGLAPNVLEDLPIPTHAFIGGSSGNMREIIEVLIRKNKNIRIVINAIAINTISEVMKIIEDMEFENPEIIQLNIAKNKMIGKYQLMQGLNPIYIIVL